MKVLHVISSGGMYGAEAVILNLSRTLGQAGHQSSIGVFSNQACPNLQLYEQARRENIDAHLIRCDGQIDRTVPRAIRQLALTVGADLVHAHGYKADVYAYFALRKTSIPLISTCHTWYDNDVMLRLYGALDRWVLRHFAMVIAVSGDVQQRLQSAGIPDERIRLIRNGVELSGFDGSARSPTQINRPLHVGLVGRLSQEKGVDIFVRAAAAVLLHLPQTQFVVAGDGPDRPMLQALIAELGLAGHVALLGRMTGMGAFYASLDLQVSASRQEGLPIALLEGMASGLPLVATSVGAVPTLVRTGCTGDLVPPDNAAALAAAILALLRDPQRRQRYAAAARDLIAREYSSERMTADYLAAYEEVLRGRSKPDSNGVRR